MAQPSITYTLTWGANNSSGKLSGKTFTNPSGNQVDCNTLTVSIEAPQFKNLYVTAVKEGNDYGFINDVLVDIRETNPTGVLIQEWRGVRSSGTYTATINATNHLTAGGGTYRVGLYIQNLDGTWNYEYFFVPVGHDYFDLQSEGVHLQVPVITS